jgi:hypothetical protein
MTNQTTWFLAVLVKSVGIISAEGPINKADKSQLIEQLNNTTTNNCFLVVIATY